jgi:hypothetical protein
MRLDGPDRGEMCAAPDGEPAGKEEADLLETRADAPAAPAPPAPAPVAKAPRVPAAPPPARLRPASAPMSLADIPPAPAPPQVAFNRASAAIAIASMSLRAGGCKPADMGSTAVPVTVTFAPSGQATRATVDGGPLAGSGVGRCVAQLLRSARARPFDGPPVTVSTSFYLR